MIIDVLGEWEILKGTAKGLALDLTVDKTSIHVYAHKKLYETTSLDELGTFLTGYAHGKEAAK